MIKKIKNLLLLLSFILFFFLITKHYFSEKNIIFTYKSRSTYNLMKYENNNDLPLLKNDTSNIITYKNDIEEFKKKRKKWFWENLISSSNE